MRKTFFYRAYLTKAQRTVLNGLLEECRWVYNETLAARKAAWEERQEKLSLYQTQAMLTKWKSDRPTLKLVHSQVLQNAQLRVDLAFKAFFRRVKAGQTPGFPRFKGEGRYDSMTYPQAPSGCKLDSKILTLSKVGAVKLKVHRLIEGEIKTVTIKRSSTNKWYTAFSVEVEPQILPAKDNAVGIDVGIKTFAMFSNGKSIENPKFFKTDEKALTQVQRRLSAREKGTPNRKFRRKAVARVHERIGFRRKDFAHQEARRIVNKFGIICLESLNIKGMIESKNTPFLHKSIADASWGAFVSVLTSKAGEAGRQVAKIDPKNTTQRCSRCQVLVPKNLSVRVHRCHTCGLVMDRDHNAAINILAAGLCSLELAPRSSGL